MVTLRDRMLSRPARLGRFMSKLWIRHDTFRSVEQAETAARSTSTKSLFWSLSIIFALQLHYINIAFKVCGT